MIIYITLLYIMITEEVDALHSEVNEMQSKYERLQDEHNKSLHDLESTQHKDSQLIRATSMYIQVLFIIIYCH